MPDELVNNAEQHRYELRIDGEVAGVVEYRFAGEGRIVLTHTEVDERYEGHGLGSRLARGALDDARAHGWQVVPRCPFIAEYIQHHPEYADLTKSKG